MLLLLAHRIGLSRRIVHQIISIIYIRQIRTAGIFLHCASVIAPITITLLLKVHREVFLLLREHVFNQCFCGFQSVRSEFPDQLQDVPIVFVSLS